MKHESFKGYFQIVQFMFDSETSEATISTVNKDSSIP